MHKITFATTLFILFYISSTVFAAGQVSQNMVSATGGQPLALQIIPIIKSVQAAGYPLIKEIELRDGAYRVKALDPQGIEIEVVVDPQKGTILSPGASKIRFSLIDAITQVVAKGYHGIYKVEADDGTYDVYAIDDKGNKVMLEVDAVTGEVSKSWF